MKIEYVHFSDPDTVKVHDTVASLQGCIGLLNALGAGVPTQQVWDNRTVAHMDADVRRGHILRYEIKKE